MAASAKLSRYDRVCPRDPGNVLQSVPPGLAVSTIRRRVAAIQLAHRFRNFESPTTSELVRGTLRGIARTVGTAPWIEGPRCSVARVRWRFPALGVCCAQMRRPSAVSRVPAWIANVMPFQPP